MRSGDGMIVNVLVSQEEGIYTAHCLELDIVAEGPDKQEVLEEIQGLITAAVDYAFSNDNLAYLYRPAPRDVWEAFYRCLSDTEGLEEFEIKAEIHPSFSDPHHAPVFVPPWVTAKMCQTSSKGHVR